MGETAARFLPWPGGGGPGNHSEGSPGAFSFPYFFLSHKKKYGRRRQPPSGGKERLAGEAARMKENSRILFFCLQLFQHPLPGAQPGKYAGADNAGRQMGSQVESEGPPHRRKLRLPDQDHQGETQKQTGEGAKRLPQGIDPHAFPYLYPQCPQYADLPGPMEHRQPRQNAPKKQGCGDGEGIQGLQQPMDPIDVVRIGGVHMELGCAFRPSNTPLTNSLSAEA